MSLLATLRNLLARKAEHAPDDRQPVEPDPDDPTPDAALATAPGWSPIDGVFIDCDYVDSKGEVTRRPFVIWAARPNSQGRILLMGQCGLRQTSRTLRADRVLAIHEDGAALPAAPILTEIIRAYGIDIEIDTELPSPKPAWHRLRSALRGRLHLLAALARCDGNYDLAESGAILDYACAAARRLEIVLSDADCDATLAYIQRLRPTMSQVEKALEQLADLNPSDLHAFALALQAVARADGVICADERAFLIDLETALTR